MSKAKQGMHTSLLVPRSGSHKAMGEVHRRKECHSGVTAAARSLIKLLSSTKARKLQIG